jgi:hypothetical protein
MSIPSTKASTVNVDQGSDKISLARADIKQNIDNVNEIIDHLDAAGSFLPAVISYESTTTTQGTTPAPVEESPVLLTAGNTGISIVAGDSAGGPSRISIPAGTYLLETNRSPTIVLNTGTGYFKGIGFKDNNTGDYWCGQQIDVTGAEAGSSTTMRGSFQLMGYKVFASTAEIELIGESSNFGNHTLTWQPDTNPVLIDDSAGGPQNNSNVGLLVKITKLA